MKRVLLITKAAKSGANLQTVKAFAADLNKEASDVTFSGCAVQELLFSVRDGGVSITLKGTELHTLCDVVHLRNTHLFTDYANALRLYADHFGIEIVNRTDAVLPYYGKVSQGFLVAMHGISTPSFISSVSNATLLEALASSGFDFPIVLKHHNGTKGSDNYLVHSLADAQTILAGDKEGFLVQQFVANSGELRILRFGNHIKPLIFKKQAAEGEYLNNTSQGGSSTPVAIEDVDTTLLVQATQASELMGRDVAGVDVLLGNDGRFYVLEVNTTPAIASGAMLEEKQELYTAFFSQTEEA